MVRGSADDTGKREAVATATSKQEAYPSLLFAPSRFDVEVVIGVQSCRSSSRHPVFHLQLRHARELADVAGDHNKPVCSSDRGDHQVSIADGTALCGQMGTDAGIAVDDLMISTSALLTKLLPAIAIKISKRTCWAGLEVHLLSPP
jgi:hypothetical protein